MFRAGPGDLGGPRGPGPSGTQLVARRQCVLVQIYVPGMPGDLGGSRGPGPSGTQLVARRQGVLVQIYVPGKPRRSRVVPGSRSFERCFGANSCFGQAPVIWGGSGVDSLLKT